MERLRLFINDEANAEVVAHTAMIIFLDRMRMTGPGMQQLLDLLEGEIMRAMFKSKGLGIEWVVAVPANNPKLNARAVLVALNFRQLKWLQKMAGVPCPTEASPSGHLITRAREEKVAEWAKYPELDRLLNKTAAIDMDWRVDSIFADVCPPPPPTATLQAPGGPTSKQMKTLRKKLAEFRFKVHSPSSDNDFDASFTNIEAVAVPKAHQQNEQQKKKKQKAASKRLIRREKKEKASQDAAEEKKREDAMRADKKREEDAARSLAAAEEAKELEILETIARLCSAEEAAERRKAENQKGNQLQKNMDNLTQATANTTTAPILANEQKKATLAKEQPAELQHSEKPISGQKENEKEKNEEEKNEKRQKKKYDKQQKEMKKEKEKGKEIEKKKQQKKEKQKEKEQGVEEVKRDGAADLKEVGPSHTEKDDHLGGKIEGEANFIPESWQDQLDQRVAVLKITLGDESGVFDPESFYPPFSERIRARTNSI
jgi:hypothetical protein